MASYKPSNLQPVCIVPGCKRGASILSLNGSIATWMLTCCKHHFSQIPQEWLKPAKNRINI